MSSSRSLSALLAVCLAAGACQAQLHMKRVALVPQGHYLRRIVLADTDHDGKGELIYETFFDQADCRGWEILEYSAVNRLVLVKSDTGTHWPSESIVTGNFMPNDAGDVDRDGRSDVVGTVYYADGGWRIALCTAESPDSTSYPDSLNWVVRTPNSAASSKPPLYCDLDRDSAMEILTPWDYSTAVFENTGDNRESLVCQVPRASVFGAYVVDDYDLNGRTDYAFLYGSRIDVHECVGDNQYAPVCSLWVGSLSNASDLFSGHDADGSGRPEFFVPYAVPSGMYWQLNLYQFEAPSEHEYEYYFIDTTQVWSPGVGRSVCADLDGDGSEELVWGCGLYVRILKATEAHQFQRVGYWPNDQHGAVTVCNAADYNGNGYPEVYVGGCDSMSVLEVEAIRVLNPDTSHSLHPGDSCEIRWRAFQPPRCGSVSLFLKTDTTIYPCERFWRLDTIATGLSPTDSTFDWVVPDTVLDRAWVVAIAYGPGWQYDESDSAFQIAPPGVAETPHVRVCDWALDVSPNPASGRVAISYDVPYRATVRLGLYDAGGRWMQELVSGELAPGRYSVDLRTSAALPAGIYFVRLDAPGFSDTKKMVLVQ